MSSRTNLGPGGAGLRFAIVGSSTLKGKELAEILPDSALAAAEVRLLDNEETTGQLEAVGEEMTFVQRVAADNFEGADIVFFGGESSTGAAVARKEMAGTPLAHTNYVSGDGIQNQQFLDVAGPESENSYATVASANADELPTAATFVKEYKAAYGQAAGAYSASAYVATMVLVDAIAKAARQDGGRMPTRDEVLELLRGTSNFSSILGVFSFDQNGDTTLKIVSVWKAKQKRWTFLTQRDFAK